MNDIQEYFQRVVALSPGTYFSVHHSLPGAGGVPVAGMPGIAYQDFVAAEKAVLAWVGIGHDVYLGMGAQKECEQDGTAIRKKPNTVAARCLYMDMDVKPETYASTADAAKAISGFVAGVPLPQPTIIVQSGSGGFHVYWTLSELITPKEHDVLTHQLVVAAKDKFGLRFDSKCTVDLVHLFRVPNTFNFKHSPPKPVKLVHVGAEVDVDVMRKALARFKYVAPKSNTKKGTDNDDLRGGQTYKIPTIDQVADFCPFIKETLDSGGANLVDDPQWHTMAALSCHCVDPSATIHRLCSKSDYYKHDDTEKKLAQAQNYRSQNPQLGPPKCVSIKDVGAPHCATCPHLALGTTPLAVPFLQPPAQVNGFTVLKHDDLPPGYFRDDHNRICAWEKADKDSKAEAVMVFPYAIHPGSAYLEKVFGKDGLSDRLTFMTWQAEEPLMVSFDTIVFSENNRFSAAFLAQSLPVVAVKKGREFFVSFIKILQDSRGTIIRVDPLGWEQRSGVWGFAYDGEYITPNGKFPCKRADKSIANYKVVGSDQVWRKMADLVLTNDRPDLMVLVAAGFAAPLVQMSGQNGYLLGTYSAESGIGKTTSLTLTQGIWTEPALGGFTDTVNYTFGRCVQLKSLPVVYDEIKGDQQTADFTKLVFGMTGGREKGRSDRTGKPRETKTWHTNIVYATNSSIVSSVAEQTTGTYASIYRVFEFEALAMSRRDQLFTTNISELSTDLKTNYGGIGKIYAEYLGKHHDAIETQLRNEQIKLAKQLGAQTDERFWVAAMATVLCGAALAEYLKLAPFDLPVMKKFLVDQFLRMRNDKRLAAGDYSNPTAVYSDLSSFIEENRRYTICTATIHAAVGRPTAVKNPIKILDDRGHYDEVGIQISVNPKIIRIRETFFSKKCQETKRPRTAFYQALQKFLGADRKQTRLTAGTRLAIGSSGAEWTIIIDVAGTPLAALCDYDPPQNQGATL